MPYDLHIVRSKDWFDASTNPIFKHEVDALIRADRELSWSPTDYMEMKDEAGVTVPYFYIVWKGQPCFWWHLNEVRCASPLQFQILKMVKMARILRARVVGDDGEEYKVRKSILGNDKILITRP